MSMKSPALRLAIICAVAALALALVNSITAPKIEENERIALEEALAQVSLDYTVGEGSVVKEDAKIWNKYPLYQGSATSDNLVGYILELKAMGYGGEMKLLGSYTLAGEVLAAELLTNAETPGIGKLAEKDGYMHKFVGTGTTNQPVPVTKGRLTIEEADAISGATITFLGIAKALAYGSAYVQKGVVQ